MFIPPGCRRWGCLVPLLFLVGATTCCILTVSWIFRWDLGGWLGDLFQGGLSGVNLPVTITTSEGGVTTQSFDICLDAPVSRLQIGGGGQVQQDLNLRQSPGVAGRISAKMKRLDVVTVSAGPVCADGVLWWQLSTPYGDGWAAEGRGKRYYLVPISF